MSTPSTNTFTYELTNETLTLIKDWGVKAISIFNKSTVNGSVTGNSKLGARASGELAIEQNKTITMMASDNGGVLDGVVIDSPVGCTLQIMAEV
jgi:hypothetical protein